MRAEVVLPDKTVLLVETDARDRRAFELLGRKQLGLPMGLALTDAIKLAPENYLAWLAYSAAKRTGTKTVPTDWDTFAAEVIEVRQLDDEGEGELPDPTKRGA